MAQGNCNVILNNNTIVFNSTQRTVGGGICTHGWSGGAATFSGVNNIIYFNTCNGSDSQYGAVFGGGATSLEYSCCSQELTGTGNITSDPMFVNATIDDYHLQYGSPCINAGDPASPPDPDGTRADMGALYYDQTGIGGAVNPAPVFEMYPASPNPFSSIVNIPFSLPDDGNVKITIFDIAGREVFTITDEYLTSGFHSEVWDGRNSAGQRPRSGVYFCRCEFDGAVLTKQLILIGD
ncbi:MAG: T9SS type A sorting domain-containing protein [Candidatus Aegiribacteria sp.]|nr:T9SS type A sorting domain-containing protein [Candidatus Aegiribacteria sp.]